MAPRTLVRCVQVFEMGREFGLHRLSNTKDNGRAYVGQFHQGKFHGQGRMVWNTPKGLLIYEGQYVEDAKHGSGRFEWPDGGVYDGEWSHGKMWGLGWYTDPNGERRQGEWVEDRIQRWIDEPTAEIEGANEE